MSVVTLGCTDLMRGRSRMTIRPSHLYNAGRSRSFFFTDQAEGGEVDLALLLRWPYGGGGGETLATMKSLLVIYLVYDRRVK